MADERSNTIVRVLIIAAIAFAAWKVFFIKRKPKARKPAPDQFGVEPVNCEHIVSMPLAGPGLHPHPFRGPGWCGLGDAVIDGSGGFGHIYALQQAEQYSKRKENEAIEDINLGYVQFRLINSTGSKQTVDILNTTQDVDVLNGSDDAPASPDIIYLGTSPSGLILKSIDSGVSFSSLGSAGYGNPTCFCQLANGDVLYGTDTGYVVNNTQSTQILVGVGGSLTAIGNFGNHVWCVGINGDVYYSSDGGDSFVDTGVDTPVGATSIIALAIDNVLFFSTGNGIVDIAGAVIQAGNFTSACDAGSGTIYAGDTSGHIWESTDYGQNWNDLGDKTGAGASIDNIQLLGGGRLIMVANPLSIVKYTDDGFATLQDSLPLGGIDSPIRILKVSDSICLISDNEGGGPLGVARIWRSIDNGENFSEISGNPQQGEQSIDAMIFIDV